jgi:hypothetical protein
MYMSINMNFNININKNNIIMNLQINNTDILYTKFYNNGEKNDYKMSQLSNNILDKLDNFLLVIDLPHQGGGARFFLDIIISYYKQSTTILVVKNINSKLNLIINNEYLLNDSLTVDESITFIDNYKHKISKIFFNHIIDHNKAFILKLFTINKETIFITHDYYLLCNKPQVYMHELISSNSKCYLDINKFDKVITQNQVNIDIFNRYYKKNINIIELPDFKKSKKKIITNNDNNIIVGIIGFISIEKGKEILDKLNDYFKNTNIKIVVFGYVEILNFTNYFTYNNISELNSLLTTHKPNLLLELSLWPETYSYTLTLSMLTQLPILCLTKKFKSVVTSRLGNYDKVYYFKNYQDVVSLINKHKQDYFYTIEETIYLNELWNHIFLVPNQIDSQPLPYFKNMQNKNVIFITSKIIVSNNSFSYVKNRSYYTKQERLTQTIKTIESIRKYIPNSYIILLDNSIFNNFEYNILEELTDTFINITDNYTLNFFTDIFEYKAFGEISQQLAFLNLFLKEDYLSIKNFFKITGRYELNFDFNYHQYDNNLNIFKKDTNIDSKNYYFTCFYKLDKSILKQVQTIFETFIQNKEKYMNNYSDLEVIFPNAIIDNINVVDNLGVIENIGVWKKIRNI